MIMAVGLTVSKIGRSQRSARSGDKNAVQDYVLLNGLLHGEGLPSPSPSSFG